MKKKKIEPIPKIEEKVLKKVEEDLQKLLQGKDGSEVKAIIEEELKKQKEIFKEQSKGE